MESPGDKEPMDSITEELERPLLDQFSRKNYSSHEYMSDTNVSEPKFEDYLSMTTDATDVTLYASSCPDFECMRGTPVTEPMFKEGHADLIRRTRSFPSVICIGDTPVTEPMYGECSTMTSEIARDAYVTPPWFEDDPSMTADATDITLYASSCPDFECTRGTPVTEMFEEGHTDLIRRQYEEYSTLTSEVARDTYVAPPCDKEPVDSVTDELERPLLDEFPYEEYPTLTSEIARDTYVAPPWIHDILRNHLKLAPQEAPPQTDIDDLESGKKAALQQPPQENTGVNSNQVFKHENLNMKGGHESSPFFPSQCQTESLSMKGVHGSSPFFPSQRQTENLNMDWGHESALFFPAQSQIENHDVEWGHEPDPQQTRHQTKVDDPASEVIYIVRLLLAMYMIMLPYLGWGHGSGQRQTENQDVTGGNEPDPQQTRRKTKVDDPAGDVMYIVRSLLIIYNLMLAYLGWGPTSQSPRQKHMILYWVSIGMVAYAIIAVLVVLKMYKMGGAWTWWATFFRYTISLAALIGCIVLLVFVSRH